MLAGSLELILAYLASFVSKVGVLERLISRSSFLAFAGETQVVVVEGC